MLSPLAGNSTEGSYTPEQVYAGEAPPTTTYETVASGFTIAQYTVMGRRADGLIVPIAPGTTDEGGTTSATGTLTFGGQPTALDTLTINGVAITFVAAGATGNQVNIGGSATLTAQAVKTFIQAHIATLLVNAAGTGTVLTLTAETAGTGGNAITLAKSGTYPSLSAATLTGGLDEGTRIASEAKAFCIAAQAINAAAGNVLGPVWIGGVFNHELLVWPASLSTEVQRKAAFDGTPISVKSLK